MYVVYWMIVCQIQFPPSLCTFSRFQHFSSAYFCLPWPALQQQQRQHVPFQQSNQCGSTTPTTESASTHNKKRVGQVNWDTCADNWLLMLMGLVSGVDDKSGALDPRCRSCTINHCLAPLCGERLSLSCDFWFNLKNLNLNLFQMKPN